MPADGVLGLREAEALRRDAAMSWLRQMRDLRPVRLRQGYGGTSPATHPARSSHTSPPPDSLRIRSDSLLIPSSARHHSGRTQRVNHSCCESRSPPVRTPCAERFVFAPKRCAATVSAGQRETPNQQFHRDSQGAGKSVGVELTIELECPA